MGYDYQMEISNNIEATALALMAAFCAGGQTLPWDFEDGDLRGWTQTGEALTGQPVCKRPQDAEMRSDYFADHRLGGDYWQGLEYPLGQHGNCVVTSSVKVPASEPWSLTSPELALPSDAPFLSFLIGGTKDAVHQRIELQVRRDRAWETVYSATGNGGEQLRQEVFEVPAPSRGLPARVRIFDNSATGHINVDYIHFTSRRPDDVPAAPVWGYADYHTHPMTYLAFGSTGKRRIIFGNPGGNYDDYLRDPHLVSKDVPYCYRGHGGGYLAEAFINNAQLFSDSIGSVIKAFLFPHKHSGGPQFKDFPDWLMGAHQQMHVTMIRRNYEGGLRLMVALVTDNWGAGFLTGVTRHGQVPLEKETDAIVAQMNGLVDLAKLNSSWMEIAKSPADARRIIQQNKLAIVPGVELDQLGSYYPDDPNREVEFLWDLGVRAVTPVHAVDNAIGSPAIINAPYNWLNDFIANGAKQVSRSKLPAPMFFDVEGDDCAANHEEQGQCVMFRLDPFPQLRLVIARTIFTLFRRAPSFVVVTEDFKTGQLGQKHQYGLGRKGPAYIRALRSHGMIVDTAHMSDKSVNDTYAVLEERPGYPAVISHAHYRKEGLYDDEPKTEITGYLASEYDIGDSNLEKVKNAGGVVGTFMHQARINPKSIDIHISHIANDCGNSSKGFAFAFHYAQDLVPGGVGLATDMTFIPTVSPRFGDHPCEGYKSFQHGQTQHANHRDRDKPHDQKDPVWYVGVPLIRKTNQKDPLKPYVMDDRTFEFNRDGLAHFGLIPDMLQDLKNVEMPKRDLQALFGSAEAYLEMWERVERAK
jgi:microsomal dipeptidase-like Zn-dependent dipeptidase